MLGVVRTGGLVTMPNRFLLEDFAGADCADAGLHVTFVVSPRSACWSSSDETRKRGRYRRPSSRRRSISWRP
jgi:hypothetical protein